MKFVGQRRMFVTFNIQQMVIIIFNAAGALQCQTPGWLFTALAHIGDATSQLAWLHDPAVLTLLSRAEPVSGREPVLPRCPLFRFHIGEYPGTRKRMKASKFPPTAPSLERESELLCESAPKLHDSREPV